MDARYKLTNPDEEKSKKETPSSTQKTPAKPDSTQNAE